MKYQDYYAALGVERSASKDQIQKAFRGLARKYHPDVNKAPEAEAKFKEINEAYEVLGNEEKRKAYDQLGANWKAGQEFRPPPNWEELFGGSFQRSGTHRGFSGTSAGGFSDFFQQIFGGMEGASIFGMHGFEGGQARPGAFSSAAHARKGQDIETEISVSLHEAFKGTRKKVSFEIVQSRPDGTRSKERKSYVVNIPAGTKNGSVIRLSGQGGEGVHGGQSGNLLLKVNVLNDREFRLEASNLTKTVEITPWEAALGTRLEVETLDGKILLSIPAGAQSGQKLRVKGRGFPRKGGGAGDFFAELRIVVPAALNQQEKELFQKLSEVSEFNPRAQRS